MGKLEEVLASLDAARRTVGRNVQDLVQQPALYVEKVTDALRNTNRGVVPVASNGELTNRPLSPSERAEQTMGSLDFGGGLGVIKPRGGNWLSGQVENALRGLKRGGDVALDGPVRPEIEVLNQWIEGPLTKYIKRDMASPNDPIRALADKFPAEKAAKLAEAEAKVNALRQKQQAQAATRGVPEEYLTRTRQEVLAAEEARDLIAENQGLHYVPPYTTNPSSAVKNRRATGGFPAEGVAQTDLAKAWENTADSVLGRSTAKDFQYPLNLQEDPWLAKVDPSTPVYNIKDAEYEPGFSHMIDELRNSLREGRISPEVLGKMNMEQAVRHVAGVNALRAVEANKARAMDMADMPLHKDYPTEGMSWRQLQHENEDQLQKWLTQEGDAMGHCVGGYCPDVKEGRSNIYSLRDAKGQPYVTIETNPTQREAWLKERTAQLGGTAEAWASALKEFKAAPNLPPQIAQIKGKGNAKPADQYLPFVQDFIRSGKWSDIQDAQNTGLTPEEINQLLGR